MQSKNREQVTGLLAQCFGEVPKAGAVLIVVGEEDTQLIVINMDAYEVGDTLLLASHVFEKKMRTEFVASVPGSGTVQ